MSTEPKHSMKSVVHRTGLSPHLIRIWEKRYGAVTPQRTGTNRRLYSEADIDRLRLLAQAIRSGCSISQIARLDTEQLVALVVAESSRTLVPPPLSAPEAGDMEVQGHLAACLAAVEQLDPGALEMALMRASVALSQPLLLDGLIAMLMETIGTRWYAGSLRVAHEHLASAIVRTFLGNLRGTYSVSAVAPNLVVTTPAGQLHEIGALMAACLAAADGWHVTYLGPNLPAAEIAVAAQRPRTRAIALSLIYPDDDPRLSYELRTLHRALPPAVVLLVSGRAALAYREILESIGACRLSTIASLRSQLAALRASSAPGVP
ncbi:MAG: MerR family transcriptional regulator [Candidatus Tectimicrobiota bacterium]